MPIYEYECKCGNEFEKIVKVDTNEFHCPKCKQIAPKIMSSSSFKIYGYSYANSYTKSAQQQMINDGMDGAQKRAEGNGAKPMKQCLSDMNK